ncbi:MAG: SDR family oxidoreductase [Euryhalocaulis sp.]|uniref:SDR family oxidoreductase n=1 Tax=Euryhalocaulis sp. TaxID=2744307 RepID=UPI00183EADCC|nr:SDR family oxidoreductase [Euryhalocaulis sp.]MBA4801631.1 SDR family oxidoreductase [Euryhalocaulis sp.]
MADKVALVTGAGKRIGRAIALGLGRAGWRVIVHYNSSDEAARAVRDEIRDAGGHADLAGFDLEDVEAARAFISDIGIVHALINNASVFEADTPQDVAPDQFLTHLKVNLMAPVLLASEMAKAHTQRASGCVINLLDQKLFALNPDHFSYTLSKYALLGATKTMAMSLAPAVRVNAIAPGLTLPAPGQSDAQFEKAHRMNPMQGGAEPEDHVRAIEFILATPSMTGQVITIDGGEHLSQRQRDVSYLVGDED